jgi:PAC2 family
LNPLPIFSQRTLLVAFEGWNDAAEAATQALKMIAEQIDADSVQTIDPEEYAEFHYARPQVFFDESGNRQIRWPATELLAPGVEVVVSRPEVANLFILLGIEPALRWRSFVAEILEIIEDRDIQAVVFVGSMIADAPHTRPIKVMTFSQHEDVRHQLDVEKSDYEGPVGILTVLSQALEEMNLPTINLWAQVPAYVHQSPSPKVTLALLTEIERILGISFDHGTLAEEAFAWERGIDEIAEGDEEMTGYIQQLEQARDELQQSEGSGDLLASEFEKFLRQSYEGGNDGKSNESKPGETGPNEASPEGDSSAN